MSPDTEDPGLVASNTSQTPQQALAALLEHHVPTRLLHVGSSDIPAVDAFSRSHENSQIDRAPAAPLSEHLAGRRYDLVLVADCLEHLPKRDGLQLLGGIRNLNTSRMAVLVDLSACNWQATDFFALALQISARFERDEQTLTLFTYDLLDYKQVPDWLNAKFWANPQMFGKYWW
ncbi:response regulator transcription factor [Stutzerimonas stutzeri]|uniref:DUF6231 family protein n=1 Tax=Stutzerimonas stutzeri TaxID=316 RepID=UPI0005EB96DA